MSILLDLTPLRLLSSVQCTPPLVSFCYSFLFQSSAKTGGSWEGLRKRARALENEIDLKLVSYSKLGTNFPRNAPRVSKTKEKVGVFVSLAMM